MEMDMQSCSDMQKSIERLPGDGNGERGALEEGKRPGTEGA